MNEHESTSHGAVTQLQHLFAHTGGITGAFTSKVDDYSTSRPNYPGALIEALRKLSALFPGALVADIGAGTGLLAHQLLRRGYRVTAVEPNDAMRNIADRWLSGFENYSSSAGSAEDTTLSSRSIDLVTVAQAFHWFDVKAARREWLRILKPEGRVALVWNHRPPNDPLQQAIDEVLRQFGGRKHAALTAQQELSKVPPFFAGAYYEEWNLPHEQQVDRSGFLSLVLSRSSMPDRGTPAGDCAERILSNLFDRFAHAERVTVNYRTVAFVGRPVASSGNTDR